MKQEVFELSGQVLWQTARWPNNEEVIQLCCSYFVASDTKNIHKLKTCISKICQHKDFFK